MNDIGPLGRALIALHDFYGDKADPAYFRRVYQDKATRAALIDDLRASGADELLAAIVELDGELASDERGSETIERESHA